MRPTVGEVKFWESGAVEMMDQYIEECERELRAMVEQMAVSDGRNTVMSADVRRVTDTINKLARLEE